MELESAFDRVLNLNGKNTNDFDRVHKHARHGTNHQVRHRTRDLTPEMLNKIVLKNNWNNPEIKTKEQRTAWESVQTREADLQRERFAESIGNNIFARGRGNRTIQDIKLEDHWQLIEAIRQGRVDMRDQGQGASRPGFTYSTNGNTRDPSAGLPPEYQQVIKSAWENAQVMNPSLRPKKIMEPQNNSTLDVGNPSENDVSDRVGMKTSDYQQVQPVNSSSDRFTQTRVHQMQATHQNSRQNAWIFDPANAQSAFKRPMFQNKSYQAPPQKQPGWWESIFGAPKQDPGQGARDYAVLQQYQQSHPHIYDQTVTQAVTKNPQATDAEEVGGGVSGTKPRNKPGGQGQVEFDATKALIEQRLQQAKDDQARGMADIARTKEQLEGTTGGGRRRTGGDGPNAKKQKTRQIGKIPLY